MYIDLNFETILLISSIAIITFIIWLAIFACKTDSDALFHFNKWVRLNFMSTSIIVIGKMIPVDEYVKGLFLGLLIFYLFTATFNEIMDY